MVRPDPAGAVTFAVPRIESEQLTGGRLLIRSAEPLADHPVSVVHDFRAHSEAHPDLVLVAERGADGEWQTVCWGEMRQQADRLAQGLLDRGLAVVPAKNSRGPRGAGTTAA